MTLLFSEAGVIYFAHIPKTGGSSISSAMINAGAKRALHARSNLGYLRCPPQHMHRDLYIKLIPKEALSASFAVVRNPVDRLVSEFKYLRRLNMIDQNFPDFVRDAFSKYKDNNYIYQNHIRPQSQFVTNWMTVFKFENPAGLQKAVNFACDALTLPRQKIGKENASSNIVEVDSTLREIIIEFYKSDCDRFNYK
jgi:hypothetical protein